MGAYSPEHPDHWLRVWAGIKNPASRFRCTLDPVSSGCFNRIVDVAWAPDYQRREKTRIVGIA